MAREDRSPVRACDGMLLRPTDRVNRAVGYRKVDLVRGRARSIRAESQIPEESLSDPMMALVLEERATALLGEPALPAEPRDESQMFEGSEVG